MSNPISLTSVWATMMSIPSIRVRSTPVIRCSSLLSSNRGAFLAGFAFFLLGSTNFLLQYKQQFRTPVTLQALGNFLMGSMNPRITEFRQLSRIAFSAHNRPNDGLSGQSAHIADDVRQLHVHLRQCFLHTLNARRCSMYVFSPLPPVGTKYANLRRRLEGVVQQSISVQLQ